MLVSNAPGHARRRRPAARALAHKMIEGRRARIRALVRDLIEEAARDGDADFEAIEPAVAGLNHDVASLLDARRRAPCDDFLTKFIERASGHDRLSEIETLIQIVTIIAAGSDTTRFGLTMLVSLLHQHPDQWAAVVEDPGWPRPRRAVMPGSEASGRRRWRSGAGRRQALSPLSRCRLCHKGQRGSIASAAASAACSSTFAPFSAQPGRIASASLWLSPSMQGQNTMAVGATLAM